MKLFRYILPILLLSFVAQAQPPIKDGAILAEFSVSDSTKVYFSKGNLRFQAGTKMWRFAERQWDVIGDNKKSGGHSSAWIDLFCWGTSGWLVSPQSKRKQAYFNENSDIADTDSDWGVYNKIANGGNKVKMWRTLTRSEWDYVLHKRPRAEKLLSIGRVGTVNGLILLPDNWTTPSRLRFVAQANEWKQNTYTPNDWLIMQSCGAVFLPSYDSYVGAYWSSSCKEEENAYILKFTGYTEPDITYNNRGCLYAVRLVQDVKKNSAVNGKLMNEKKVFVSATIKSVTPHTVRLSVFSSDKANGKMGYCIGTDENLTIESNSVCERSLDKIQQFDTIYTRLNPETTYYIRPYIVTLRVDANKDYKTDTIYGTVQNITTRSVKCDFPYPEGAIHGWFSSCYRMYVAFSKGNLQYRASTNTWRFAEHQWDIVGPGNEKISSTYNGWIDLFAWATSGFKCSNGKIYKPYTIVVDDYQMSLFGKSDWGYNKISNGGQAYGQWATLDSYCWEYIIFKRTDAKYLSGYARIKISEDDDWIGLVLLPDDWKNLPDVDFVPGFREYGYFDNQYTIEQWAKMEANGAVFLPSAGYRYNKVFKGNYYIGWYWTSTYSQKDDIFDAAPLCMTFNTGFTGVDCRTYFVNADALPVRLVHFYYGVANENY
ncbi:MAG: hypothetical protein IK117_09060 [Bacteroidales bacterium]|nr:hypothetical protein [Bacteroidales bacterium]